MIQGPCRENQRTMIHSKVMDYTRDFLFIYDERNIEVLADRGFDMTDQDDIEEVNEIKASMVTMMLSLLEGAPDQDIIK